MLQQAPLVKESPLSCTTVPTGYLNLRQNPVHALEKKRCIWSGEIDFLTWWNRRQVYFTFMCVRVISHKFSQLILLVITKQYVVSYFASFNSIAYYYFHFSDLLCRSLFEYCCVVTNSGFCCCIMKHCSDIDKFENALAHQTISHDRQLSTRTCTSEHDKIAITHTIRIHD